LDLASGFDRCQRDREVLDREAGRVEGGDLGAITTTFRFAREYRTERSHVLLGDEPRLDGMGELTAVARLLQGVYICNTF
jgi:hypothetical protein